MTEKDARSLELEEIKKANSSVCNIVGVGKMQVRAVPKNPMEKLMSLTELEKYALDLWCGEGYDNGKAQLKLAWYESNGHDRTVYEFESGDPIRIEKEKEYIRKNRWKALKAEKPSA